ncbi:MAG TPA: DUF2752 domain-containing protein [Prolixibacteraceae bacterium]|nr:DUF2752 domain-containing protein [Prolixibacteraceae bacterium]
MGRNKLYVLLSSACAAGYIWLMLIYHRNVTLSLEPGVCMFKRVTGVPCPSCGSTRSVLSILNGDIFGAILWNPIGIIIVFILLVFPFWIIYDVLFRKDTLYRFYNRSELFLRRNWIAIPAILLVLLNWIWNILKGL